MNHEYGCGTNDTPLPAAPAAPTREPIRRIVSVDAYRVPHDPEWDRYAATEEDYLGDIHIVRHGKSDRWIVRAGSGVGWLCRDALSWRERNGNASLRLSGDNRSDAAPERREIQEMFHYASMPSWRSEDFDADHTFTLAEAFFVCCAEAP